MLSLQPLFSGLAPQITKPTVTKEPVNRTPDEEARRLIYLKNVVVPILWSHPQAAYIREAATTRPKEFSLDLMTIQRKFTKVRYYSSSEALQEFYTLFDLCQNSRNPAIRKAGRILSEKYNDKIRGFEKLFSGADNSSDVSTAIIFNEVDNQSDGQTCSSCLFLNDVSSENCDMCGKLIKLMSGNQSRNDQLMKKFTVTAPVVSWSCPACTFLNNDALEQCEICGTVKNASGNCLSTDPVVIDGQPLNCASIEEAPSITWTCPECTFLNSDEIATCEICDTPRNLLDLLRSELDQCHGLISDFRKVNQRDEALSYPKNWTGSEEQDNRELRMIQLAANDDDFVTVFNMTASQFRPLGIQIKSLRRIENWEMYKIYSQRKALMEKKMGPNTIYERWLFHGTTVDCVDHICRFGFNRSYCGKNGTIIGKGVYFSSLVATSFRFALPDAIGLRRMFLCRVLTGFYTGGSPTYIEAPLRTPTERFDSVVENVRHPSTFVVFTDYQAYPEYELSY